eukprot:TRINITY_DN11447_c0_g8_i1.p1 TRINITY_DN11447_c0_g8~~TRINITY_DN11447_c0_g8_i1.p1  ORF type:complete len:367 (+),score=55.74 TRINITY_DN11447_c0_g8_i1:61-1161(+)
MWLTCRGRWILNVLCLSFLRVHGVQLLVGDFDEDVRTGNERSAAVNDSYQPCDEASKEMVAQAWLSNAVLNNSEMLRSLSDDCVDKFELHALEADARDLDSLRAALGSYDVSECHKTLLPSVVYLGQGHSGSTTLAMQLDAHPELSYGTVKEHHWGEQVFSGNGHLQDYTNQFRVPCRTKVSMDFSAGEYVDGHHGSHWSVWRTRERLMPWNRNKNNYSAAVQPELLRDILGKETKLIVMLRDPVDFLDSLPGWWEKHVRSVDGDCYAIGVERWLNVFPRQNVLFLKAEEYFADSQAVLSRIFKFLDVAPWDYPGSMPSSGRRRQSHNVSFDTRRLYHTSKHHAECRKRLERLTGITFDWPGVSSE